MDQDRDGFGLFGGSPGMDQVAAVASQDRTEQEQGFGFFESAPGSPNAWVENLPPRQRPPMTARSHLQPSLHPPPADRPNDPSRPIPPFGSVWKRWIN